MKRSLSLLLSLALVLGLLLGCAPSGEDAAVLEPEPAELTEPAGLPDVQLLAEAALPHSGKEETLELEALNREADEDRLATYIEAVCGLTADQWEDAAVIRGLGASAFEIVVLRLGDEDAARELEPVLADYLAAREGAFAGYAPAEAEMAANGQVRREERTVGLFICPNPEGAAAAYHGETLPAPVEPEAVEEEPFQPPVDLSDLLRCVLIEAACPEWHDESLDGRWSDSSFPIGIWVEGLEEKYGFGAEQYERFVFSFWGAGAWSWMDIRDSGPYEVLILLAKSEEGAAELAESLKNYLTRRAEWYRAAGDEDAATLVDAGRTVSYSRYAALFVCDHPDEAVRMFPRAINSSDTIGYLDRDCERQAQHLEEAVEYDPDYPDRLRFDPPNKEDMSLYDTFAILAAWESGDPSALTRDDREIYDAAKTILAEIMRDGMTDLEKETAAYRWTVDNVNYDWSHMDALAETARRAYGPYGGLVNRVAVCLGYAATFQLLMDMSGAECITVVGACVRNTGDHAWNMVKLNGEWYCVDATWDANAREQLGEDHEWQYFNLTSDEMAAENHQWDYANTPEATATDRGGAAVLE